MNHLGHRALEFGSLSGPLVHLWILWHTVLGRAQMAVLHQQIASPIACSSRYYMRMPVQVWITAPCVGMLRDVVDI